MGRLDNMVALVTASTDGIGFAIARKLAQDGAHVVVSSRRQVNVDRAVKSLQDEDLKVTGMICHVAKKEERKAILKMVEKKFGRLDILVSNAAVNPFYGNILKTPESAYDKMFEVNVKATFMLIQEAVPLIDKQEKGVILIVSSVGGFLPNLSTIGVFEPSNMLGVYGVTKTALMGMTKALVPRLTKMNIRINCLAPGIMKTGFSRELIQMAGEDALVERFGLKRLGTAQDCAGIVAFLCSDEASYINGEVIVVAGGAISHL